ncbi:hypothetical protein KP509_1Z091700 [Ceratopteris richardii]|nr:hypothetical protein KP509_1Z091700 [Ceratopteris richardii]
MESVLHIWGGVHAVHGQDSIYRILGKLCGIAVHLNVGNVVLDSRSYTSLSLCVICCHFLQRQSHTIITPDLTPRDLVSILPFFFFAYLDDLQLYMAMSHRPTLAFGRC